MSVARHEEPVSWPEQREQLILDLIASGRVTLRSWTSEDLIAELERRGELVVDIVTTEDGEWTEAQIRTELVWPNHKPEDVDRTERLADGLGAARVVQLAERCCDEDNGGSHYHCSKCGEVTSMLGHWVRYSTEFYRPICERRGLPFPFEGFTCQADVDTKGRT